MIKIKNFLTDLILKIRLDNPSFSKEKIYYLLIRDYSYLFNDNTINNNNATNTNNNNNNINNTNKPVISISTIGRILKQLQSKSLITLKSSKLKSKYLNIENEDKLKKSRDFSNSYSKPWNFEEHFIGDISTNINRSPT